MDILRNIENDTFGYCGITAKRSTWCYKSGWPSIAPTGVVWQGSEWPLVWFLSTKGVCVRQFPSWTVIPVSTKKGDSERCVHCAHCHRSLLRWSQLGVGTFLPKIVLFMRIEIASKTATLCGAMLLSIPYHEHPTDQPYIGPKITQK